MPASTTKKKSTDDEETIWSVPVEILRQLGDPCHTEFKDSCWGTGVITREAIQWAIYEDRLGRDHWNAGADNRPMFCMLNMSGEEKHRWHTERIAFLVVDGWSEPIDIEVPFHSFPKHYWLVQDGNHRLAAAIHREDKHIVADVSGFLDFAAEILRPY